MGCLTRFSISRAEVDTILEREGQWEGEQVHTRCDGRTVIMEDQAIHISVQDQGIGIPTFPSRSRACNEQQMQSCMLCLARSYKREIVIDLCRETAKL